MNTTTKPTPEELLASVNGWIWELAKRSAMIIREHLYDSADIYQLIAINVLRRAPKYDPARAAATTWATFVARSTIDKILKHAAGRSHQTWIADEGDRTEFSYRTDSADAIDQRATLAEQADILLATVNSPQREWIELVYLGGEDPEVVGSRYGVTGSRVRYSVANTIRVLKKRVEAGELEKC